MVIRGSIKSCRGCFEIKSWLMVNDITRRWEDTHIGSTRMCGLYMWVYFQFKICISGYIKLFVELGFNMIYGK